MGEEMGKEEGLVSLPQFVIIWLHGGIQGSDDQ